AFLFAAAVLARETGSSQDADPASNDAVGAVDEPLSAMPSYKDPTVAWKSHEDKQTDEAICRDRIHEARKRAGQPELQRGPASNDEPVMIWAVDRRENGCAVLVAKGVPDDIRPIPEIEPNYALRPAR